jgi:osmotically-inducible protein OsmY
MKNVKLALAVGLVALPLLGSTMLTGCASTAKTESVGQYVDSSAVTLKVKAALAADKQVESLPITVNTYKNGVQLSGYVDSSYQKHKAGKIASRVPGVMVVQNALIVKHK